jgi:hypothetical protein
MDILRQVGGENDPDFRHFSLAEKNLDSIAV